MAFSEQETKRIRGDLMRAGEEAFSSFGLRRTRVEDLVRQAGIAKGSFYRFFDSKEELCFTILEDEEKRRDQAVLESAATIGTHEELALLLVESFDAFEQSRVAMRIYELDELKLLVRKLPPERLAAHQENDRLRMETIFASSEALKLLAEGRPEILAGLFRALFMISLHRAEIGIEIFEQVRKLLLSSVARGLWRGEEKHDTG